MTRKANGLEDLDDGALLCHDRTVGHSWYPYTDEEIKRSRGRIESFTRVMRCDRDCGVVKRQDFDGVLQPIGRPRYSPEKPYYLTISYGPEAFRQEWYERKGRLR